MTYQRNHCLDGLRGYAALIVVIHHYVAAFWPTAFFRGGEGAARLLSETPLAVLINGPFFVYVFFVLSGYVLAGAKISKADLPRYFVARYIRLALPAGISVILAFLALVMGLSQVSEAFAINNNEWLARAFPQDRYPWWRAGMDALGSYLVTGRSYLNSVLWTMRTEFFGSILVYIVSCLCFSSARRISVYVGLCLLALALERVSVFFTYFAPFMSGAVMREAGLREQSDHRCLLAGILLVGLFLGGSPHSDASGTIYQPLADFIHSWTAHPLYLLKTAGAVLLVFAVIGLRPRFFESGLAVWLGDMSFAAYLTHMTVLVTLGAFNFANFGPQYLFAQGVLYLGGTYLLAIVFNRFADQPAVAWSRVIKTSRRASNADEARFRHAVAAKGPES